MTRPARGQRGATTWLIAALAAVTACVVVGSGADTGSPSFTIYQGAPNNRDGEPSIGVDWETNSVMFQSGTRTYRVTDFNPAAHTATWTMKRPPLGSFTTLDPILFTDVHSGRTFVSHLTTDCSVLSFSDDAGQTWTTNPFGCGAVAGPDHQTVGGGPLAPPLRGIQAKKGGYPNAVYYCSQGIVYASCARSLDGGLTFAPAVPAYHLRNCNGLHGHIKVAPDGVVYVPNASCHRLNAVVVSEDNGLSWSVRPVPGSDSEGEFDPGVGIGAEGTVYLAYQRADVFGIGTRAYAAVSRDNGRTWTNITELSKPFGLKNIQFPSAVAGDDDRAAIAFLGTKTDGNDQSSQFNGIWHLYVSITIDGGKTWRTVDVTPDDPVQRGMICAGGIGCNGGRNLLDFMDITIDREGRVYVGYADGCVDECVYNRGPSNNARSSIARQDDGFDLIAAR